MITLITGTPGAGKTAWIVNELLKLGDGQRNVYVHGIRGLKLPHVTIYCKSDLCDLCSSHTVPDDALMVEDWPDWKQKGDLIVIDEVQRIWRPRASGSNPPRAISMLETHRHYGVDFWLSSQGPHLFDSFVRALVGRHIHLVANWAGRSQYEWPECKQALQYKSDAIKRPYSLPKKVFGLYTSAELHTKIPRKIPLAVYGLVGALVLLAVLLGYLYQRFSPVISAVNGGGAATKPQPQPGTPGENQNMMPAATSVPLAQFPDFTPEKPGLPESAPAYRHLIQVKVAPTLAGCIKNDKECRCFTQQATPYPATQVYCENVVAGNAFNPYVMHQAPPPQPGPQNSPQQNPSVEPDAPPLNVSRAPVDNTDIPTHSE